MFIILGNDAILHKVSDTYWDRCDIDAPFPKIMLSLNSTVALFRDSTVLFRLKYQKRFISRESINKSEKNYNIINRKPYRRHLAI
ncbi:Hypothetical predicted protein [Octopus vulgaris]|uniref:Uncharacterized protein n=1 Tax=Octopus vulgaris TaxID=6645 RepID=A0AA36F162_OCTVU|nr:Hypothetical predicted protein [Octopus vulgaris]